MGKRINSHWVPCVYMRTWADAYQPRKLLFKISISEIHSLNRKINIVFYKKQCCSKNIYNSFFNDENNEKIEQVFNRYETRWNNILNCINNKKKLEKKKDEIKEQLFCMLIRQPKLLPLFSQYFGSIIDNDNRIMVENFTFEYFLLPTKSMKYFLKRYDKFNICILESNKYEFVFSDYPVLIDVVGGLENGRIISFILPVSPHNAIIAYNQDYYTFKDCETYNVDAREINYFYTFDSNVENIFSASKRTINQLFNTNKQRLNHILWNYRKPDIVDIIKVQECLRKKFNYIIQLYDYNKYLNLIRGDINED